MIRQDGMRIIGCEKSTDLVTLLTGASYSQGNCKAREIPFFSIKIKGRARGGQECDTAWERRKTMSPSR